MLEINWGDVLNILNNCKPYLIGFAAVAVIAVAVIIAVSKREAAQRKFIRAQALFAIALALAVTLNGILLGPMSTIISLAMGEGSLTAETLAEAETSCNSIADEGVVLLKNSGNLLPLTDTANLNVFGWASTNPCYGGTGSGALNDAYEKVTLLQGLEQAGFALNGELSDFYVAYRADHPTISPFTQDWTLPEPPASSYPETLLENARDFSDTALIVLSRTGAEHGDLPTDVSKVHETWAGSGMFSSDYVNNSAEYEDFPAGTTFLDPSQSERDMIGLVCDNFTHVVVVYNGSNAMNLSFVDEYPAIEGCVWCAGPGQNGFNSLGDTLKGVVNPSGRTSDTFIADFSAAPFIHNVGGFKYDNMTEFVGDSWGDPTSPTFVNYVEGIYVGYKYYETAYAEAQAGNMDFDYDAVVQYPFGYGLSYASFRQEMSDLRTDADGNISFDVTVANTGNVPGKDVVEVYFTPPYTDGGIEKAAVNLLDFDKTDLLNPGASETITFTLNREDMSAYDYLGRGCYVLEAGDYGISINADAHTPIETRIYSVPADIVYDGGNGRGSDVTPAVNQLDDSNGDVEYLSRAGGFANYDAATAAPVTALGEEYKAAFVYNNNYDPAEHNDPNDAVPLTGQKNGMELMELRGADYDDPRWETLLDQITVDEMNTLIAIGGFTTSAAPSVGKIATTDCDGPASINNNFTNVGSIGFPSGTMIACTWNKNKALEFGQGIGKMADEMNVSGWYAPAMNTHRSPFAGRNFEYYSEDGVLSGKIAAQAVLGAADYGVYAYIKHFALNDQEMNRQSMLCTWSNEQATREVYLKPFELCVKAASERGSSLAVMSSYNYIGVTYAGAKNATLNNILRDEWGFRGFVLTDYNANFTYMNSDQIIRNGGDSCLSTYDVGANYVKDTQSATALQNMRRASKNILYTVVNSRAYAEGNYNDGMESWMKVLIVIDFIVVAIFIALESLTLKKYRVAWKSKAMR